MQTNHTGTLSLGFPSDMADRVMRAHGMMNEQRCGIERACEAEGITPEQFQDWKGIEHSLENPVGGRVLQVEVKGLRPDSNPSHALPTDSTQVAGVPRARPSQKRKYPSDGKGGQGLSPAARAKQNRKLEEAQLRAKDVADAKACPILARRYHLLGDEAKPGSIHDERAGYPLGIYFLRGDITEEQFNAGRDFFMSHDKANRVYSVPSASAKSASYGAVTGGVGPVWEPTERDQKLADRFFANITAMQAKCPAGLIALRACLLSDVMGDPTQRLAEPGEQFEPAYTLDMLKRGLDWVAAW